MKTSYYILIRQDDANYYRMCGNMDDIHEWLEDCKEPLFAFEGMRTDEYFHPKGYDLVWITDEEIWNAVYKRFYAIQN